VIQFRIFLYSIYNSIYKFVTCFTFTAYIGLTHFSDLDQIKEDKRAYLYKRATPIQITRKSNPIKDNQHSNHLAGLQLIKTSAFLMTWLLIIDYYVQFVIKAL